MDNPQNENEWIESPTSAEASAVEAGGPAVQAGGPAVAVARRPRWSRGRKVSALAVAVAMAAGGFALVSQANADPKLDASSTAGASADGGTAGGTAAPDSTAGATAPEVGPGGRHRGGGGDFGAGIGAGPGETLHGELVVVEHTPANATTGAAATDVTKTIRVQTGQVTAIGDGSLTVLSTDSFSATYTLGTGVDVTGIAVGDTVSVRAEVNGDVVTAVRVHEKGTDTPPDGPGAGGPGVGGRGGIGGPGGRGAPGTSGAPDTSGTSGAEPTAPDSAGGSTATAPSTSSADQTG